MGARTLIAAMKISADGKMEGSEDTAACVFAEACTTATRAPFCLTPLVSSRVGKFRRFAHREPRHRCYHVGKGRAIWGMIMLLGCIADDFTGATDLANMLVRGGMRTIQAIGVPTAPVGQEVDAVVIALKSRTIDAAEAVAQSLSALDWLQQTGCSQFYFKYCSTFDSTPKGNIGPVTDAPNEGARHRFHHCLPGISRGRSHHLPRLSLRR